MYFGAIANDGEGVQIWNVASGSKVAYIMTGFKIPTFSFSRGSDKIAVVESSENYTVVHVQVWDITAGTLVADLTNTLALRTLWGASIGTVTFSHDDRKVLTDGYNTILLWDISPSVTGITEVVGYGQDSCCCFGPDATIISAASCSSGFYLIHRWIPLANGVRNIVQVYKGHKSLVHFVGTSNNNEMMVSCGKSTIVWDIVSGCQLQRFSNGPRAGAFAEAAFTSDSTKLVTRLSTKTQLWNIASGGRMWAHLMGKMNSVDVGTDIVTCSTKQIRMWNLQTGLEQSIHFDLSGLKDFGTGKYSSNDAVILM
jgi:hypothetical protein